VRTLTTYSVLLGLVLPLAVATQPACKKGGGEPAAATKAAQAPKVIRVETQPAVKHTFSGRLPITGELKPIQEVTLKSRVGGNVVLLRKDEGDVVKKGELIAKIEAANQQAQFRSNSASVAVADAQLARAKADLERISRDQERVEKLAAQGAVDQKTLDDTRTAAKLGQVAIRSASAQLEQARAARDLAKNAVGETKYVAPISGVISRRGVSLHEYVDTMKNRDIVTIVDNSAMELVAQVAADLASGITKGSRVEFQVNSAVHTELTGEVTAVSPTVDPRTRTIRLRVRIPNKDGVLKGGMFATGFVTVGGERQGVGVPQQALRQEVVARAAAPGPAESGDSGEGDEGGDDKQSVVWVVKNGIAEKLTVHTGVSDGDLMEVLGSIAAGDQVIVSSPAGLKSGTAVTATSTAAAVVSENK
jgi:membrane fusion protein (multidrug efflux system)